MQHAWKYSGIHRQHDERQRNELHLNAKALTGLQAVENLQVMRPRLRPVLPRMGGCLRGDVVLPPVPGSTVLIISAKCRRVVEPFIPEAFAKREPKWIIPCELRQIPLP